MGICMSKTKYVPLQLGETAYYCDMCLKYKKKLIPFNQEKYEFNFCVDCYRKDFLKYLSALKIFVLLFCEKNNLDIPLGLENLTEKMERHMHDVVGESCANYQWGTRLKRIHWLILIANLFGCHIRTYKEHQCGYTSKQDIEETIKTINKLKNGRKEDSKK